MTSHMCAQRSSRIGATQQPASHQPVAGSSSSSRRLTARRPAATRRLRAALQHLCPVTHSPQSAASTAQPPAAAPPATDIAAHLGRLDSDGVTIVKGVFSGARIAAFRSHLTAVWSSIQQSGLESLDWSPMRFKPHVLEDPCFCFGKALYEGKLTADYMGTDLTDMGRGRYDLAGGLLRGGPLESVVTDTPALTALVGALLADGWIPGGNGCPGALPTLQGHSAAEATDAGGLWHRDAYSLFGDEALELQLPPFYCTAIIPLESLRLGEGATEFVIGSHRVNLSAAGLTTGERVAEWAAQQPRMEAVCEAGDACLFSGYVLHRGAPITAPKEGRNSRDVLYMTFRKAWLNSEPVDDYLDESLAKGVVARPHVQKHGLN
jgi:hypothetical protein